MQVSMTRQDLQSALDYAKNKIIERMVSKSEVQNVRDRIIVTMNGQYQQQQQWVRQSFVQVDQQTRRIANLEQELKGMRQLMSRLLEEQKRLNSVLASMPNVVMTAATRKEIETAHKHPQYEHPY